MVEYSLLNPSGRVEADVKTLAEVFPPIFEEFWNARGREWYRVETARVDAVLLAQLWSTRTSRLFLAKDGGQAVGFLLGSSIPSMFHAERTFQVEALHGRTPEIERGLLEHLAKGFEFFPDKFLSLPGYVDAGLVPGLRTMDVKPFTLLERA